ncbi:MAG: threonylcarbamoyl-AMP synthase, partial [Methanobrevibacter sp.]|nr:threonylcarbamoyl-AMP synthase [Methanobrevibacter sp.]
MKIIKMDPKDPDLDLIDEAIEVLAQGKLVIYPTDTIYGLGANIFDENAVNKIYNIKKRDKSKSLSICLSSIEAISFIANIPKIYEDLLIRNLPGPFTFLIQKKAIVPKYLLSNTKNHSLISKNGDIETKIGVRVPDCKIAMALAQVFPITATSANLSGQPT